MKIILSGGGTLGPVVPLLAIADAYKAKYPAVRFVWIGTKNGPEKELIRKYNIPFFTLAGGKWRRYFSFWNIADLIKIIIGFFQSFFYLWKEKPALLISAGGFVSVPLHWAAFMLGIPTWIHQQDFSPGLANKLMARTASKITTALQDTVRYFSRKKTEWIGNPTRNLRVDDLAAARERLGLAETGPVIFALGGGTGSARVNQMVIEALNSWPKDWQVIHLVGKERPKDLQERMAGVYPNYHVFEFFTDEMKDAYSLADVVIARAGFASITECAAMNKASIFIPMSDTHQELNANFLARNNTAIIMEEKTDTGLKLAQVVSELMRNPEQRQGMGRRLNALLPAAKEGKIVAIIDGLVRG